MSLFGAMNTAISGLSAQSNAFGNISDNVANSQTIGYKRVDTAFIDYLTTSTASNNVPGAVVTRPEYVNNVEGTITQTDNALGLAITGQGFFAVSKQAGVANNLPTFDTQQEYTRAGDFQMDKNGYLKNSAGLFLNGWPVTIDPTTGTNVVNQNTLKPIQISQTVFNPVATSNVAVSANLPATPPLGPAPIPPVLFLSTDPDVIAAASQVSIDATAAALAATNAAIAATTAATGGTAAAINAALALTASALTATNDAGAAALLAPTPPAVANAAFAAAAGIAALSAAAAGHPVPASDTAIAGGVRPPPAAPITSNVDVYDSLGTLHTTTLSWQLNPAPAAANSWTVSIAVPDDVTPGGFSGSAVVTFGNNGAAAGTVGSVNNPQGGNVTATSGSFDPTNPNAQPSSLTFSADFGSGAQPILLKLGTYGQADGITQYAGTEYNLRGLTQDGVPPGAFSSVSTANNGDIAVNYDNGQSRVIARVPIVTFNNPNGLQRQDGQAFTVSQDSGGPLAETASTNGAGDLLTQSIESSNVDIASEFTKLIVAQRAYSANTKIVTTSDDMLQQTIDMKR